jgi:hypothetical protein
MVDAVGANYGLAEAMAGVGFDVEAAASSPEHDVVGELRQLLVRAQKAGAVRGDVDAADVKALIVAACTRGRRSGDIDIQHRMIRVIAQGLRPSD